MLQLFTVTLKVAQPEIAIQFESKHNMTKGNQTCNSKTFVSKHNMTKGSPTQKVAQPTIAVIPYVRKTHKHQYTVVSYVFGEQ